MRQAAAAKQMRIDRTSAGDLPTKPHTIHTHTSQNTQTPVATESSRDEPKRARKLAILSTSATTLYATWLSTQALCQTSTKPYNKAEPA